jgi:hypothetical protein
MHTTPVFYLSFSCFLPLKWKTISSAIVSYYLTDSFPISPTKKGVAPIFFVFSLDFLFFGLLFGFLFLFFSRFDYCCGYALLFVCGFLGLFVRLGFVCVAGLFFFGIFFTSFLLFIMHFDYTLLLFNTYFVDDLFCI